jgi:hypothetical protein
MTTTYANLVDEISLNLSGYTLRQDRTTHLTDNVTSSGLSLSLGNVGNIGMGVIEIDDELIWLDTYDRISSTATIAPYGRGYHGTTAAAHTANTKVTVAPSFPYNAVKTTYSLPADTETILYVSYQPTGPTGEWLPLRNWRQDGLANTGSYATGQTVSVYDRIEAGRTVQVYYTKKPSTLTAASPSDTFETVTGLPSSCKDVIVYGAAYRLSSFIDPGRLNYSSAEADNADTKIQYGSGASTARFLLALYQQRLTEESKKLRDVYPTRIHYTRY